MRETEQRSTVAAGWPGDELVSETESIGTLMTRVVPVDFKLWLIIRTPDNFGLIKCKIGSAISDASNDVSGTSRTVVRAPKYSLTIGLTGLTLLGSRGFTSPASDDQGTPACR